MLTATRTWRGHFAAYAQRLAQHPLADRHDEPRLLGDRHEFAGRDGGLARRAPTQQRLEAGNLVALDVEQRLKVESELAVGQRAAQPALEVVAAQHARVHLLLEEAVAPRASCLVRLSARSASRNN